MLDIILNFQKMTDVNMNDITENDDYDDKNENDQKY